MDDRACVDCIHHVLVAQRRSRGKLARMQHVCTDPASIAAIGSKNSKTKAQRGVSCDDARRMNDRTVCGPHGHHWVPAAGS
jgi:hypothetical protein